MEKPKLNKKEREVLYEAFVEQVLEHKPLAYSLKWESKRRVLVVSKRHKKKVA